MQTTYLGPLASPLSQHRGAFCHHHQLKQIGKEKAGHDPGDLMSLLSLWLEFLLPSNLHFDYTPTATQIFEFSDFFSGFSEALAA